jgi:hypothetical protein
MNHEDGGFDCPGCAWPDDPSGLHLDLCENGVKHTTWELARKQASANFSPRTLLVQAVRCALSPPVTAKEVPLTIRA